MKYKWRDISVSSLHHYIFSSSYNYIFSSLHHFIITPLHHFILTLNKSCEALSFIYHIIQVLFRAYCEMMNFAINFFPRGHFAKEKKKKYSQEKKTQKRLIRIVKYLFTYISISYWVFISPVCCNISCDFSIFPKWHRSTP